jgi:hypothetical protein
LDTPITSSLVPITSAKPKPVRKRIVAKRKPANQEAFERLLDQPYIENRIQRLLEARGVTRLSIEKREELGFNKKSWGLLLRNQMVPTHRQCLNLAEYFGLADPGELFWISREQNLIDTN